MKKQILIFAMLTLAIIFAGTNLYAQPNLSSPATCLEPTPLDESCKGGLLSPSPGSPYVYTVNVANLGDLAGTGAANITWVVTTSQTFIDNTGFAAIPDPADGTGYIAAIGAGGVAYNTATAVDGTTGNSSIEITWNAFTHDPDNPVFLVAYATDAGGVCTSDNMDAWIIEPTHSFTLDIENLALDGTSQVENYKTCVAPVASAEYIGTVIEFDYGINYMFFQVNAANFSGSWQPSFQVGGDAFTGSRVATAVEWSHNGIDDWKSMTPDINNEIWTTTTENVPALATGGAVGADGECIVVRVTLANNQDETIAPENVTLAVNGTMEHPVDGKYTGDTYKDIDAKNCTAADFDDIATQVLTPRPQIEEVQPTDPFVGTNRN